MVGVLIKMIIGGILLRVILSVIRHAKLTNIYLLKLVYAKKRLFGKLVLAFADEILNTSENSFDDKKVT